MTMRDGGYLDFEWDGSSLKSIHSVLNSYRNNTLDFTEICDFTIIYLGEKVIRVSQDADYIVYTDDDRQDTSVHHHSYVYNYEYDNNGLMTQQKVYKDNEGPVREINYSYSNGKIVQMSIDDGSKENYDLWIFEWNGNNITQISMGRDELHYNSYDNHPNPLRFSLGYEMFYIWGGFVRHWNENNFTEMDGVQCQYDYDAGGDYPVRMYVNQGGEEITIYEFEYKD